MLLKKSPKAPEGKKNPKKPKAIQPKQTTKPRSESYFHAVKNQ